MQTNQRYVYNLAYHLCNDHHEADDLTQETFLRAFENFAGFRQEASLRTWLSRIALNTYLAKAVQLLQAVEIVEPPRDYCNSIKDSTKAATKEWR